MTGINLFQILNGLTFAALLFIVASGFTNGPAVGEVMGALLRGRAPPISIEAYAPRQRLATVTSANVEH